MKPNLVSCSYVLKSNPRSFLSCIIGLLLDLLLKKNAHLVSLSGTIGYWFVFFRLWFQKTLCTATVLHARNASVFIKWNIVWSAIWNIHAASGPDFYAGYVHIERFAESVWLDICVKNMKLIKLSSWHSNNVILPCFLLNVSVRPRLFPAL